MGPAVTEAGRRRWRRLRPRHTTWPTRDGWWCLFAAVGLGVAAVNTGNNLVYLLCAMLLALIVVSGVLSELTLRGLRLTAVLPDEVYAGRAALFGAIVANAKRRRASHSVAIEILGPRAGPGRRAAVARVLYLPQLEAGAERLVTWEATLAARGCHRLSGLRITTRFPFGLFVKAAPVGLDAEVLVFPAVGPVAPDRLRQLGGAGGAATRRRGRGDDLRNLRQYRPEDDPRLIHWRSSAKAQVLTVRELEEDTTLDTRLTLDGTGAGDPARLERGLSEAASLMMHLVRAGGGVELVGPGLFVPLGRGRGHARRILTALALYEPGPARGAGSPAALREIRISLD